MMPMIDSCICDSDLIQVIKERTITASVAIGEEFSIQLFEITEDATEVEGCTLSDVSVSSSDIEQAFSARADENANGLILVSPTNAAVFQMAAIEPLQVDIKATYADGTKIQERFVFNLSEFYVCGAQIAFEEPSGQEVDEQQSLSFSADDNYENYIDVFTGTEFLSFGIPPASSTSAEDSEFLCKIAYRVEGGETFDPPIARVETYGVQSTLILGAENSVQIGLHDFHVVAYYESYPTQLVGTAYLNFTINLQLGEDRTTYALINEKPEFSLPPEERAKYSVPFSQAWQLDLGEILDPENDAVSVEFTCTSATNATFVQLFVDETGFHYLSIEAGSTSEEDIGSYEFELVLTDIAEQTIYQFTLEISTEE